MEHFMEEYGGILLAVAGAMAVFGMVAASLAEHGNLYQYVMEWCSRAIV